MRRIQHGLLAAALTAVACIAMTATGTPARADGAFRWQNVNTGWFLEVWQSQRTDLADVITYPYNASSPNQIWDDFLLSDTDPYFALMNRNSGKVLDRWDYGYKDIWGGAVSGSECSRPMQYSWTGQNWQWWRFRVVSFSGNLYNFWINKEGCAGDPFHDVLSDALHVNDTFPNSVLLTLYSEDWCADTRNVTHQECYWNRVGA